MKELTEIRISQASFDVMWLALQEDGISRSSIKYADDGIYNLMLPGYLFVFTTQEEGDDADL